jgi:hypothetical protein
MAGWRYGDGRHRLAIAEDVAGDFFDGYVAFGDCHTRLPRWSPSDPATPVDTVHCPRSVRAA